MGFSTYFKNYVASKIGLQSAITVFFNLNWIFFAVAVIPIIIGLLFPKHFGLHNLSLQIKAAAIVYIVVYSLIFTLSHALFYRKLKNKNVENVHFLNAKDIGILIGGTCL